MKKISWIYSDEVICQVAESIVSRKLSWKEAQVKYGIKSPGSIGRWIKLYKQGLLPSTAMMTETKSESELSNQELLHRIKNLKRRLREREVQVQALGKIIQLAEEELQVDIRKKSGTEQPNTSTTDIPK